MTDLTEAFANARKAGKRRLNPTPEDEKRSETARTLAAQAATAEELRHASHLKAADDLTAELERLTNQGGNAYRRRELLNQAVAIERVRAASTVRSHVVKEVGKLSDPVLGAAFFAVIEDASDFGAALEIVAALGKSSHVNGPTLRYWLKEYFEPSRQTMKDAGLTAEQQVLRARA